MWFIPFIIILSMIIFVHEMGHYLVARWNNVTISTFSVGFGRELWARTDRHGTRWRIAMIPLGGYVRFVGDMDLSKAQDAAFISKTRVEDPSTLFVRKNVFQRMAIVLGGPIANFLLTFVILWAMLAMVGRAYIPAVIGQVMPGSVAEQAGLQVDDTITAVDGFNVLGFHDFSRLIQTSAQREVTITLERFGVEREIVVVPQTVTQADSTGRQIELGRIGATSKAGIKAEFYRPGILEAVGMTLEEMYFFVDRTLRFIADLFVGRSDINQLGGVIRVAEVSAETAQIGLLQLINLTAILSLNIGLFNLFPIPVLDGGHLSMYLIEWARGKPLPAHIQEYAYRVGLVLILSLMVFTFLLDLRVI